MRITSVIASLGLAVYGLAFVGLAGSPALANDKKIQRVFGRNDSDKDGKLSADEWPKSPEAFQAIDQDGDGYLSKDEFRGYLDGSAQPKGKKGKAAVQLEGLVPRGAIDEETREAYKAMYGAAIAIERGLQESSLIPVYPDGLRCPEIDHIYGEKWRGPVSGKIHTGADIPAPYHEPIHAMADGQVIAKFSGDSGGYRGLQVILRHSPEQTGLPVWLYTLYSHFSKEPQVAVGDQLRMGDYIGPNGKTGVPGPERGPHIHLTIMYSASHEYTVTRSLVLPQQGHFADPVALFRGQMPLRSKELRLLPEDQKRVPIAYKTPDGKVFPSGAKIIWPFACQD